MTTLKKEFSHLWKKPENKYCPRCRKRTMHRLRFNKEDNMTYYPCDICEYFAGEEVKKVPK